MFCSTVTNMGVTIDSGSDQKDISSPQSVEPIVTQQDDETDSLLSEQEQEPVLKSLYLYLNQTHCY